jgi:tetratricopeptide (TPR) repeat protein/transcriptional regulator with XRE-family HTH domain
VAGTVAWPGDEPGERRACPWLVERVIVRPIAAVYADRGVFARLYLGWPRVGTKGSWAMAGQPASSFAALLGQLRAQAGLTQEELAQAAGLGLRTVSDLERGAHRTAHQDTARLLADALGLADPARGLFVAAARGRVPALEVLAARDEALAVAIQNQAAPGSVPVGTVPVAVIQGLPRDIASFTGRKNELARLFEVIESLAASAGMVGIHAIDGMAGVGKTAFAVHAAHRLAGSFPDGQFFLPLHAHSQRRRPADPADALISLLLSAGVAPQLIPPGVEARAARWRDHVAGKKILLLLDDAAGHEQVTPLLPGTAGSLVIVTSRRRLTALPDATVISLDALSADEAAALLARLAGRPEINAGVAAVSEITRLSGYLPLAIGMLAAQLRHHPAWSAASLAADLARATDRLAVMRAENVSVTAAFDLSYRDLETGLQRLFPRLGLLPGPTFNAYAVAALGGCSLEEARQSLNDLYDHHLLSEPAPGRYQLHDLLRSYAADLARTTDPAELRSEAVHRVLDYYLHTGCTGTRLLNPQRPRLPVVPPSPGVNPEALGTASEALAWFAAERQGFIAAIAQADELGFDRHVWQLAWAVWLFFDREGYWHDQVAILHTAIAAAKRLGDRAAQAHVYRDLSATYSRLGQLAEARVYCTQALDLHHELGDRLGEARAHNDIMILAERQGRLAEALGHAQLALALYREEGNEPGQAKMLNGVGYIHAQLGEYQQALDFCEQALSLSRGRVDPLNEAAIWDSVGYVLYHLGRFDEAITHIRTALRTIEGMAGGYYQTAMLVHLGDAYHAAGDLDQAGQAWEQALAILEHLQHSDADQVRARLRGHVPTPSSKIPPENGPEGC